MPSSSKVLKKRRNKGVRSPRPFDIDQALTGTPPEKLRKRARDQMSLAKAISPRAYSMTPSHSTISPTNSVQGHSDRDESLGTRPTTPPGSRGSGSEAPPTTPASQKSAGRESSDGTTDFLPFKITHETFLVSRLKKLVFGLNDGFQVVPSTTVPPNSPAGGVGMKT